MERRSPISMPSMIVLIQRAWMFRSIVAAFLLIATASWCFAQGRVPIPALEIQNSISRVLTETYQLPKLKTLPKKQEAVKKLMEASREQSLSADERYVVLRTVISLTTETGDAATFVEAVNKLVTAYHIDSQKERIRLLMEFLNVTKSGSQLKPAVEEAIALTREVAEGNQYSEAASLLDAASAAIRRGNAPSVLKQLISKSREALTEREKAWRGFQAAESKLKTNPDDADVNLEIGRWKVLMESDWNAAVPFLAKGANAKWKAAAVLEQQNPVDAAGQTEIADAWFDIAQAESGATRIIMIAHAAEWYELAHPNIASPLTKKLVATRLEQTASEIENAKPLGVKLPLPKTALSKTTSMKLRLIPAGEFEMGTSLTGPELAAVFKAWGVKETDHASERPTHRVSISRPFYLGQHEVTVGQFKKFVSDEGYKTEAESTGEGGWVYVQSKPVWEMNSKATWKNPGFPQTDDHPVVLITWNDAQRFCQWLSREDRHSYRLPTEAEWEYACRSGTNSLWSNGDDLKGLVRVGNVADETARAAIPSIGYVAGNDGFLFTAPVGKFAANSFGLYDMHGNVHEWCEDAYDPTIYEQRSGVTVDPLVTNSGQQRVMRGGAWVNAPIFTRSAFRLSGFRDARTTALGFRVVRIP